MNDFEEFNVTPELTLDTIHEDKKATPKNNHETYHETKENLQKPEEKFLVIAYSS